MFNFKRIVNAAFLCILAVSVTSLAKQPTEPPKEDQPLVKALRHMYFGVQLGYADADYDDDLLKPGYGAQKYINNHYAARVYLGYDFNPYIALEATGVYFLSRPEFEGIPNGQEDNVKIKNNIFAIATKLTYPVRDALNIYVKAGMGYVVREQLIAGDKTVLPKGEFFTPIYGVGLSYNVYKDWFIDFTWLQTPRSADKQLPTENFIGLGIYYAFPKS